MPGSPRIIHCIGSAQIGGIERLIIDLAILQKENNMDVAVLLNHKKGPYLRDLEDHKITIHESKYSNGLDISKKKRDNVSEIFNSFDIVHMHVFNVNYFLAAKKTKKKIVYTIHGLSKGIKRGNFLKLLILEKAKKIYLNKVNFLAANSQFTLSKAIEQYELKDVKKKVVLNATKLTETNSSPKTDSNDDFVVGVVSRFIERKRIDRAIITFEKFLDLGGHGKMILVGDGPTYKNIEILVAKKELHEKIDLKGFQSRTSDYYSSFNVCIAPAKDEPFGLVAVESYLAGKPNLVFNDSGGLKEIVGPFEKKDIVDSIDEMASRLLYYCQNKKKSEQDMVRRKEYAKDHFGMERLFSEYLSVYNDVLKGS